MQQWPLLLFILLSWGFTSTKTIRLIRDGEPSAATSIFTQLLSGRGTTLL